MKDFIMKLAIFSCMCIPILQEGICQNENLEIISILIAALCSVILCMFKKEPYSLFKMFIIFIAFFFCVAPIIQYKSDVRFFGTYFSNKDYFITSLYVLFILISVLGLYLMFRRKFAKSICKQVKLEEVAEIKTNKEFLLIFISASVCCYYLYINNFSIMSLLFRGGAFVDRINQGQITGLIVGNFIRPMPMIIFLCAYIMKVKHKIILPILFILMIISSPPTGMARFSAAAMYIPVLLVMFPFLKKGYNLIFLIVIGLLVVFPFLDNFRHLSSGKEIGFNLNFDQFTELHFDSYSMFMRVLKDDVITFGRQLLGVIFFFVPRAIWPDKPEGSGHFMMNSMGSDFTNVSMPYFGEGYINFGFLGVILFIILISYVMAKLDANYWNCVTDNNSINQIRYFMLLGLLVFILRGDMMSSCAFTCGFISSFYVIRWIIIHK